MPTSLKHEQQKQKRWRLRPQYAQVPWFEQLLENEFVDPAVLSARQDESLRALVTFCVRHVPYYQRLFERLDLKPRDVQGAADLWRLPVLTRRLVQEHTPGLQATALPPGQRRCGQTKTSGTTGQPVYVTHTQRSRFMFTLLKQRELRWGDRDPMDLAGVIYNPADLPRQPDGGLTREGQSCGMASWPMVGVYFHTGAFVGFSNTSSVAQQAAWLEEQCPNTLLAMPSTLEHLALMFQARPKLDSLRGLRAVAQQLTPAMRRTITSVFGVPVEQNYGLNEIGLVASQCPEEGRFHVHAEHCLVEIVDDAGRPAPPGKFGRLLVTALSNRAMPLVRYDTDDRAMALEGPCPCGRTLPSFGSIQGRYRRVAWLPRGVWEHWSAFQLVLETAEEELLRPLRQYQMHHHADGRFVLRLVTTAPLAPQLVSQLYGAWERADRVARFPLEILRVEQIPARPGAKFQDFTSDLVPPPDWDPV